MRALSLARQPLPGIRFLWARKIGTLPYSPSNSSFGMNKGKIIYSSGFASSNIAGLGGRAPEGVDSMMLRRQGDGENDIKVVE